MATRSHHRWLLAPVLGTVLLAGGPSALAQQALPRHGDTNELRLIKTLKEITQKRLDTALSEVESLVEANPQFKLAQAIYADLLLAKTHNGYHSVLSSKNEHVDDLLAEAKVRWRHFETHPPEKRIPNYLIQLEKEQRTALVIDLSQSRLFVYANDDGQPRLRDDYYVSMGKNGPVKQVEGDKRTPVGVYFVTSYLPPEELPSYYGEGAFPINYPNAWDRRLKKTGYGIWLHGNPFNTFSRPPRASDGCVTLSNPDLLKLKPEMDVGRTPVVITNGIEWADPDTVATTRSELKQALQDWLTDWESLDTDAYLAHYSPAFQSDDGDLGQWARHKRLVNGRKQFIDVDVDNLSIFRYPGMDDMLVVTFDQDYHSSNYDSQGKKRQYWRRSEDGTWRIVYEGSA